MTDEWTAERAVIYDAAAPEGSEPIADINLMPDLGEWCYEYMVEKSECVHCTFGDESLILMYECPRCGAERGAKTWGWRSPDGQELCIRCMAMGSYQDIRTHEMLMPQFPNSYVP
jgi:hypothetical protein